MSKNRLLVGTFLWLAATTILPGQWKNVHSASTQRSVETPIFQDSATTSVSPDTWTSRKTVALVLSTIIPGSGQSYLGNVEKGAAFTIGTLGTGLITLLLENNIIGRNERLAELTAKYDPTLATRYDSSEQIWARMLDTKSILDDEVRLRNRYRTVTLVLWIANIIDVVFFTDDKGEKTFGEVRLREHTTLALVPDRKNGMNALVSIRF
ncbi:MAG: hypothetical protein WBD36_14825 [Bacteroidota bacterium]